jgi:hypothetical protein
MVKSCTRNHLDLNDKLTKDHDTKATMVALTKKYCFYKRYLFIN